MLADQRIHWDAQRISDFYCGVESGASLSDQNRPERVARNTSLIRQFLTVKPLDLG